MPDDFNRFGITIVHISRSHYMLSLCIFNPCENFAILVFYNGISVEQRAYATDFFKLNVCRLRLVEIIGTNIV